MSLKRSTGSALGAPDVIVLATPLPPSVPGSTLYAYACPGEIRELQRGRTLQLDHQLRSGTSDVRRRDLGWARRRSRLDPPSSQDDNYVSSLRRSTQKTLDSTALRRWVLKEGHRLGRAQVGPIAVRTAQHRAEPPLVEVH